MGCDIHWCLERKHKNRWIGVLSGDASHAPASERWYAFFAELAGVRAFDDSAYPSPKGMPEDASELTQMACEIDSWDHSHSHLTVDEFVAAYNRANAKYYDGEIIRDSDLFGLDWWPWAEGDEMRVVFAFDN